MPESRTITVGRINLETGEQYTSKLDAEVHGEWAVHRSVQFEGPQWTITHVPTGRAIARSRFKQSADTAAKWLAGNFHIPATEFKDAQKWLKEHSDERTRARDYLSSLTGVSVSRSTTEQAAP